jgi:hypothetical protein
LSSSLSLLLLFTVVLGCPRIRRWFGGGRGFGFSQVQVGFCWLGVGRVFASADSSAV